MPMYHYLQKNKKESNAFWHTFISNVKKANSSEGEPKEDLTEGKPLEVRCFFHVKTFMPKVSVIFFSHDDFTRICLTYTDFDWSLSEKDSLWMIITYLIILGWWIYHDGLLWMVQRIVYTDDESALMGCMPYSYKLFFLKHRLMVGCIQISLMKLLLS